MLSTYVPSLSISLLVTVNLILEEIKHLVTSRSLTMSKA